MAQTLKFEINNKIYDYPYVVVNVTDSSFLGNSPIIRGDFIPLFTFLELEKRSYSGSCKINNKSASYRVFQLNFQENTNVWTCEFSIGSLTATIMSDSDEIETYSNSSAWTYLAGSLAYNYYTKKWAIREGPCGFTPQTDGSMYPRKGLVTKDLYVGIKPPEKIKDLKANILYEAVYFADGKPSEFYTSAFDNNDKWTNLINATNYEPLQYPNNPDDPESPDYNPTDPTPGSGDGTSDPIGIPTKPTIDVTNTGFVTLYNPSALDIRNLAYFMWSGDFTDLIKKMFSAPFDCLIGLKLIYAPITTGASQTIWLGNVESDVSAPKITDQFTDFDCGTLTIDGYFGSFLDYSPYTKVTIFLPFIGYKQLNVDEVMNSQIHLTYRIDAYSGACIAFIHVTKTIGSTTLSSVIYEFDGNCAMDIPFTSGDMSRYVSAILGTAASTAGAVVSMGAGAKLGTQTVAGGGKLDPWSKEDKFQKQTVTGLSDLGNGSAELIAGKPQIQRGGSLAGANASMALKQPYIIIERPMQQMPADYANFIGIPLNMTKTLSQMSGFTVVSQVFMASSQATDDELNMINTLLRQGVII